MNVPLCKTCGNPESEHHAFEAEVKPDKCKCDPRTWEPNPIGPICEKFTGDGNECETCEHDRGCHE